MWSFGTCHERLSKASLGILHGVRLGRLVSLRAKVGSSRAALGEKAGEDRLDEGAEDDLGATGLRESHPQDENELEGVVEGEPVDSVDSTLEHRQECVDDPVCQPLGIINLARAEQSFQGIISWDKKTGKVYKKLASNVEED